jgi:hypothetical protein
MNISKIEPKVLVDLDNAAPESRSTKCVSVMIIFGNYNCINKYKAMYDLQNINGLGSILTGKLSVIDLIDLSGDTNVLYIRSASIKPIDIICPTVIKQS